MMMTALNDWIILVARVFLVMLFLVFGWRKVQDYSGWLSQVKQDHLPMPMAAAAVGVIMELPVSLAVALGAFTRPLAALLVFYTLGTSLSEHRFWTITGPAKIEAMESFLKNLAIMGGFALLCVTGAGKYSLDAALLGGIAP